MNTSESYEQLVYLYNGYGPFRTLVDALASTLDETGLTLTDAQKAVDLLRLERIKSSESV